MRLYEMRCNWVDFCCFFGEKKSEIYECVSERCEQLPNKLPQLPQIISITIIRVLVIFCFRLLIPMILSWCTEIMMIANRLIVWLNCRCKSTTSCEMCCNWQLCSLSHDTKTNAETSTTVMERMLHIAMLSALFVALVSFRELSPRTFETHTHTHTHADGRIGL